MKILTIFYLSLLVLISRASQSAQFIGPLEYHETFDIKQGHLVPKTPRKLHYYSTNTAWSCISAGQCVTTAHPAGQISSYAHISFACAGCVTIGTDQRCTQNTQLCNAMCQDKMTALSPTITDYNHDSTDSTVYINYQAYTNTAFYTDTATATGLCPITCTWSYSNMNADYQTNYMPNPDVWSSTLDSHFIIATSPTFATNGGWTYKKSRPFYATIKITCNNVYQWPAAKTIQFNIECQPSTQTLTNPTVFLNGTAFATTQTWTIVHDQQPTFWFPQSIYGADGISCFMYGVLAGDSGCVYFYDTTTVDVPTNLKMKCMPVGVASTSSYYLQVYDVLQYTETKNSPNKVDYTFNIATTALGPSPTLTSLTYTLQAQCGTLSVWNVNSALDTTTQSYTKNVGGTSATDYYETNIWNAKLMYCKNCRILTEKLVTSSSSTTDHTVIQWSPSDLPTGNANQGTAGYRTDYCCFENTATAVCKYSSGGACAGALDADKYVGQAYYQTKAEMYVAGTQTVYYRVEFEGGAIRYYQYTFVLTCMNTLGVDLNSANTAYLTPNTNGLYTADLTYNSVSDTSWEVTFPASPLSLYNSETVVNCGPYYEIFVYGTTTSATVETWKSSMATFTDCGFDSGNSNHYSCSKIYETTTPYQGVTNDALSVAMKTTTACSGTSDTNCRTLVVTNTNLLRRIEFTVIIRSAHNTDPVYDTKFLKFQLTVKCSSGAQSAFTSYLVSTVTNSASQAALIQYKHTSTAASAETDVMFSFYPFSATPAWCVVDFYEVYSDSSCTTTHPLVYYAPNTNTYPATTSTTRTWYYTTGGYATGIEGKAPITNVYVKLSQTNHCTNCGVSPCTSCTCTGSGSSVACTDPTNGDCYSPCTCTGCTPAYAVQQDVELDYSFYLKVSGQGSKTLCYSSPLILRVGCTTNTQIVEGGTFDTTPAAFTIYDTINTRVSPNDIYTIAGLTMDYQPYCEVYKYEVVSNTAPDTTGAFSYVSSYTTSAAAACVDLIPVAPAAGETAAISTYCSGIQIMSQRPQTWTMNLKVHYRQTNPTSIAPFPWKVYDKTTTSAITFNTVCGTVSTTIYARAATTSSPFYEEGIFLKNTTLNTWTTNTNPVAPYNFTAYYFLDFDNGLHNMPYKAFYISNSYCPITKYEFARENVNMNYTQIFSPALQTDLSWIVPIDTKWLTTIGPYKIKATAQGGATFTTNEMYVKIICGSETITEFNSSIPYVIARTTVKDSFFGVNSTVLETFFSTDKSQCPTTYYELFADKDIKTFIAADVAYMVNSPTISERFLFVENTVAMVTTFWLKGTSDGTKYALQKLDITVCGLESLTLFKEESIYQLVQKSSDDGAVWGQTFNVTNKVLMEYFVYEEGISSPACVGNDLKLYDENMVLLSTTGYPTIQLLQDASQRDEYRIQINTTKSFASTKVYLKKTTLGLVESIKELNYEICGEELISYVNSTQYLNFTYQQTVGKVSTIPHSQFAVLFQSNSQLCPILGYKLYNRISNSTYVDYYGGNLTLQGNGDLTVQTSFYWKNVLYIRPYTQNLKQILRMPLNITIITNQKMENKLKSKSSYRPVFVYKPKFLQVTFKPKAENLNFEVKLPKFIKTPDTHVKKLEIKSRELGNIIIEYDEDEKMTHQDLKNQKYMTFDPITRVLKFDLKKGSDKNATRMLADDSLEDKKTKTLDGPTSTSDPYAALIANKLYKISLILTDNLDTVTTYNFLVHLKSLPEAKKTTVIYEEPPSIPQYRRNISAIMEEPSYFGELVINFNETMTGFNYHHVYNFTELIDANTLEIYLEPHQDWYKRVEGFDMNRLNLTWYVRHYDNRTMKIQIYWNDALAISPEAQQDFIVLHFKDRSPYFLSPDGDGIVGPGYSTIRKRIKPQVPLQLKDNVEFTWAIYVKGAVTFSFLLGLFINFFFIAILSVILSMITSLQIVIHMPFLNLIMPGNVSLFFRTIIPIMLYDVIAEFKLMDPWFLKQRKYYYESKHYIDQTYDIRYQTWNPILNLGTLSFFIGLWVLKVIVVFAISKCCKSRLSEEFYPNQVSKQFWSQFLWVFVNGYICFLISAVMFFKSPEESLDHKEYLLGYSVFVKDYLLGYSVFLLFMTLVIIPLLVIWIMVFQSVETINSKKFRMNWGAIYDEVEVKSKWDLIWICMQFLRRIIFVAVAFVLSTNPGIQVILINLLGLFSLIIVGSHKPLKGATRNRDRLGIFNELTIIQSGLFFMCFSDWVTDDQRQFDIGQILIQLIYLNIFVNLLYFANKCRRAFKMFSRVLFNHGRALKNIWTLQALYCVRFRSWFYSKFFKNGNTVAADMIKEEENLEQTYPAINITNLNPVSEFHSNDDNANNKSTAKLLNQSLPMDPITEVDENIFHTTEMSVIMEEPFEYERDQLERDERAREEQKDLADLNVIDDEVDKMQFAIAKAQVDKFNKLNNDNDRPKVRRAQAKSPPRQIRILSNLHDKYSKKK